MDQIIDSSQDESSANSNTPKVLQKETPAPQNERPRMVNPAQVFPMTIPPKIRKVIPHSNFLRTLSSSSSSSVTPVQPNQEHDSIAAEYSTVVRHRFALAAEEPARGDNVSNEEILRTLVKMRREEEERQIQYYISHKSLFSRPTTTRSTSSTMSLPPKKRATGGLSSFSSSSSSSSFDSQATASSLSSQSLQDKSNNNNMLAIPVHDFVVSATGKPCTVTETMFYDHMNKAILQSPHNETMQKLYGDSGGSSSSSKNVMVIRRPPRILYRKVSQTSDSKQQVDIPYGLLYEIPAANNSTVMAFQPLQNTVIKLAKGSSIDTDNVITLSCGDHINTPTGSHQKEEEKEEREEREEEWQETKGSDDASTDKQ